MFQSDRHVVFSSLLSNAYASETFACVHDSAEFFHDNLSQNNTVGAHKWLRQMRQCLSDIQYSIESARMTLATDSFGLTFTDNGYSR